MVLHRGIIEGPQSKKSELSELFADFVIVALPLLFELFKQQAIILVPTNDSQKGE